MKNVQGWSFVRRSFLSAELGFAAVFMILCGGASAQQTIESTSDLKIACENSPGNIVSLPQGAKIINGVRPPAAEQVNTGCTLMLGISGAFEADQVSMTFDGPFNVISAGQGGKAMFVRSLWQATAMSFDLSAGPKGEFKMAMSEMQATTGDIDVRVAVEGQFQVQQRERTTFSELGVMDGAGSIRISGGSKFKAEVADTSLRAVNGISIALDGSGSVLKSERAGFRTSQGAISFTGAAPKTLMEFKQLSMQLDGGDARIVLAGQEFTVKIVQSLIGVDGGNAELRAGGPASFGLIEIVDTIVVASGSLTVMSSREAEKGVAKVGKSRLTAGSDLLIASGAAGTTEVKKNNLTARNTPRLLTGEGGNCISEPNIFSSPAQQICR